MTKTFLYISIFLGSITCSIAQIKIEKPNLKAKTKSFAIFIDQETYKHTQDAVHAYQKSVEADGLPTYIISGKFSKPEDVKKEIIKLYKRKPSLEGVVFVGEIPIPMIRNAQHMTTAFKMNETKFPIQESSVPSDRFYDDLHLTFDFIKQDEKNALHYYYKLREDSPQDLKPSLYSARIRYPKAKGGNAHEAIAAYLMKAAQANRNNILDNFVGFTGAAYNSECLIAWKDDLKGYKEDFPYIGNQVQHLKQLNFRMDDFMKFKLFDEMLRPEVDVFLMRKHGTPTRELINNLPEASNLESRLEALRRELYANVHRAKARKMNVDSIQNSYIKKYDLAADYFAKLEDKELIRQDSTVDANTSIHTKDMRNITTNPIYVILDACYNGSFHEDDYIAGHYIFNAGNTIAAQGNTRNVLQDKWTMNLTGLLSYGVRLGQVHNMNVTLENHLIGDPTFHFGTRDTEHLSQKLNDAPKSYWSSLLDKTDPIYQAIALRQLAESTPEFSKTLLSYFMNSPYRTVRLQALKQLASYADENFTEAIQFGLNDEYEMIARQAATYAGKNGNPLLLAPLATTWVNDKARKRVMYNLESNLRLFHKEELKASLITALERSNRTDKAKEIEELNKSFARKSYFEQGFDELMDKSTPLSDRLDQARSIRNYNDHLHIDAYLKLIEDPTEDTELRIVMAEALGWFNYSYVKPKIITGLKEIAKTKIPKVLKAEINQSLIRLN